MFGKKINPKMYASYIINIQLIDQWNCLLHYPDTAPRVELVL